MDLMQVLHQFGTRVVEALNEAKVKPPEGEFYGGLIVMAVKNSKSKKPPLPLAGSLNYNKEQDRWLWTEQLEQATPIAEDIEPG